MSGDQFVEPSGPAGGVLSAHREQAQERVMQLLGVARLGARFIAHPLDRLRVQFTEITRALGQSPA